MEGLGDEKTKAYLNLESGAETHHIWQTPYLLLLASAFLHLCWDAIVLGWVLKTACFIFSKLVSHLLRYVLSLSH